MTSKIRLKNLLNSIKEAVHVPLKFHWTVLFLPVLLIFYNGLLGIPIGIMIFASLLFHEYAHVFAAQRENLYVSHVVTHGFGAAAMIGGSDFTNYKQNFKVSAAGPIGSFFLSGVGLLLSCVFSSDWVGYFIYINFFIGAFNSLPIFPLDGGRILYSLLGIKLGAFKAVKIAVWVSWVLCGIGIVCGLLLGSWWLAVVLGLIIWMSVQEKNVIIARLNGYDVDWV